MTGGVWIVVTAVLLAAACAWVGSFLLLRRMALLGDVISHAVLPGIVLAYLWSGVRVVPVMLGGALLQRSKDCPLTPLRQPDAASPPSPLSLRCNRLR